MKRIPGDQTGSKYVFFSSPYPDPPNYLCAHFLSQVHHDVAELLAVDEPVPVLKERIQQLSICQLDGLPQCS